MKAFISSTSIDLVDHRLSAVNALRRLKFDVREMETFGAQPDDARRVSLDEIDECEYFVGIYAHRYGFVPQHMELSITEQEFNAAFEKKKWMFCFIVDENHPWIPKYIQPGEAQEKLQLFKTNVQRLLVCEYFTNPENLAVKIATSLAKHQNVTQVKDLTSRLEAALKVAKFNPTELSRGQSILNSGPSTLREQIDSLTEGLSNKLDGSEALQNAINAVPDKSTLFTLAKGLIVNKKWKEAATLLKEYSQYDNNNWEANFLRAISFANSRQGANANYESIRAINDALLVIPQDIDVNTIARLYTYRAAMFKRNNRLDEAESDALLSFKIATKEYEKLDALYNLACVYALTKDREKMMTSVMSLQGSQKFLSGIRGHLNDYFFNYRDDKEFLKAINFSKGSKDLPTHAPLDKY